MDADKPALAKLDFGGGRNPREGFENIDLHAPGARKVDLLQFPLPWPAGSVAEINCSHFLEHVPQKLRWPFMEECYRVLVKGGKMHIIVPNWKSERSYGDMTHEWPPVAASFFWYLNKAWRDANKLDYGAYALACDFEWQAGANGIAQQFAQRHHEAQMYASAHYCESYADMWAVLTKR